MSKRVFVSTVFSVLCILGLSSIALAADAVVGAAGMEFFAAVVTAAGFGMGIAAFGTGLGQGMAVKGAVEGTARNPEAAGKITVNMLIGLAMIESLGIYALVVALILIYAYPMAVPIAKAIGLPIE